MDQEVAVKKELVWLKGTASTSVDSHVNNAAENASIIKVEPQTSITPKVENDAVDPRTEDEKTVQTFDFPSGIRHLKEETKSQLMVSGPAQETTFQPCADVKDEVFIEEQIVDQLVPCFKEENNVEIAEILSTGLVQLSNVCCKTPKTESPLESHSLTDAGNGPSLCGLCKSAFNTEDALNRHALTHSVSEGPYVCSECSRPFSLKRYLKRHMVVHFGERKYQCSQCPKSFAWKRGLNSHMISHSGQRPFFCSECGKAFARVSALKVHSSSHSGV